MSASISRDEWLKAVGDAVQPCDPDAITVLELAEMLKVDRQLAYRQIRRLVNEGKAIPAYKTTTTAQGVTRRVTAYKLVKHETRSATRKR
jgi:predicted transcriptional regulator